MLRAEPQGAVPPSRTEIRTAGGRTYEDRLGGGLDAMFNRHQRLSPFEAHNLVMWRLGSTWPVHFNRRAEQPPEFEGAITDHHVCTPPRQPPLDQLSLAVGAFLHVAALNRVLLAPDTTTLLLEALTAWSRP